MKNRKVIALILTLVMAIPCMGLNAFATEETYALSGQSSLTNGGVTFAVDSADVTQAKEGDTVVATPTAVEGYTAVLSAKDSDGNEVTITDSSFKMPAKAVTVTVTYTPYIYLDLESSDNYKKEIYQMYTFTQTGTATYTDVTKVKLSWEITDIDVSYTSTKTWDPEKLQWVETKNVDSIDNQTAKFTFTNYSSIKVVGTVEFEPEKDLSKTLKSANFDDNNGKTIDSVVNADHTIDEAKKTDIPTNTTIATLSFDNDEFAGLSATSASVKYGTYTVTISKPAE